MKLILSLTLIWALSSTAGALQCLTCTDLQCSTTAPLPCSSETMCMTAFTQVTLFGNTTQHIYRGCTSSSACPASGNQTFSVNFGATNQISSLRCCNTDNCNSETLSVLLNQTNNGLQCYSCNGSECTTPIQCQGNQDHCLQYTVTHGSNTTSTAGCASESACENFAIMANMTSSYITTDLSCCSISLCNTVAQTTTAAPIPSTAGHVGLAVIHLLLGLLVLTLC